MRIRQIKPDFWMDEVVASLSMPARLLYIGLWNVADDGGWLRWNLPRIGAELFPYESVKWRSTALPRLAAELVESGRVTVHDCGHALVSTLTRHQRLASPERRVLTVEKEHSRDCSQSPAHPRNFPHTPAILQGERNVKGKGTVEVRERVWEGAHDGLPHLTTEVQEAGEAIVGRGILAAGDKQLTELDRLVESHGPEAVISAFSTIANGGHLEWTQLVWGTRNQLEPIPVPLRGKDAKDAEKEQVLRRLREETGHAH